MKSNNLRALIREIILTEYGQATISRGSRGGGRSTVQRIRNFFFSADESNADEEILDEDEEEAE